MSEEMYFEVECVVCHRKEDCPTTMNFPFLWYKTLDKGQIICPECSRLHLKQGSLCEPI